MTFSSKHHGQVETLVDLFTAAFSASEGAEEGRSIGALVRDLLTTTAAEDLFVFSTWDSGVVTGCIVFSRLVFDQDDRVVFILSPVAVAPGRQRQGIGRNLLNFGLDQLRARGVDIAVTYGDPAYYGKVGFAPITEKVARAPLKLSQPEGWLAQSLNDRPLDPLQGQSRCVDALDNSAYW